MSNWISVEDKKPRDGQRCLVLDDYGYMYVKPYIAKYSVFDGLLAATITHWRPLPKPPRRDSGE